MSLTRCFLRSPGRWAAGAAVWLLAAAMPEPARADRIEYKDGRVIIGIVLSESPTEIRVSKGDGTFTIARERIARIVYGTGADNLLIEASRDFKGGRMREGIALLADAVAEGVSPISLAVVMLEFSNDFAEAIGSLHPGDRERMRRALAAIEEAEVPNQPELLRARLRWHLEIDDLIGTGRILKRLEEAYPGQIARGSASLIRRYDQMIDGSLDAFDFSRALELLIQFRRLDPERAGNKRGLMTLEWAAMERDRREFDRALGIYANQLMDTFPMIARNRIFDTLGAAERVYRDNNQLGRAIELYDRYGVKYLPEETIEPMSGLLLDLGRQFLARGEIEPARSVLWRSELLVPLSAERELLECDYHERRRWVDPEDAVGLFELGEWCLESGLHAEARLAFMSAAGAALIPDLQSYALAKVRQVELARDEAELDEILGLYDEGSYSSVLARLNDYRRRPVAEGLRGQATRLAILTRERMIAAAREPVLEAEVLRQQAERSFLTRDFKRAYNLYATVLERYADTPAAALSHGKLAQIGRFVNVEQLERARLRRGGAASRGASYLEIGADTDPRLAGEIRRLRSAIGENGDDR